MSLDSTSLDRRKCAVGPPGRWISSSPLTDLRSSLATSTSVKPRAAAYWQIFFSGKPARL